MYSVALKDTSRQGIITFYYADERQKRFVTWYPERIEQRHHEQRYEALTTPVMAEARDRLELIEAARMEKARG